MAAFALGDAFYGGRQIHGDDHLWVVINDPSQHAGIALIVNITTPKGSFADLTCLVEAGEHPFVRHRSCVRFSGAKAAKAADLDKAEQANLIRRRDPASPVLLEKLRRAAAIAPQLGQELRSLL